MEGLFPRETEAETVCDFARPGRAADCETETESRPDRPERGSPTTHPDLEGVRQRGRCCSSPSAGRASLNTYRLRLPATSRCSFHAEPEATWTSTPAGECLRPMQRAFRAAPYVPGFLRGSEFSSMDCSGGNNCFPCSRSAFRSPFGRARAGGGRRQERWAHFELCLGWGLGRRETGARPEEHETAAPEALSLSDWLLSFFPPSPFGCPRWGQMS